MNRLYSELTLKSWKTVVQRGKVIASVGAWLLLVIDVIRATTKHPPALRLVLKQLYDIGVSSLPVVAITGLSTGLVLAAQSVYQLADKGLTSVTGLMVTKAMMTELGPLLTAFMVTGRVGAAMTAELGTMVVTEQVDAIQSMAINPNRYLIAPRLIAGVIMMPLLTIFSVVMGVFGGYLISVYYFGMAPTTYLDPIPFHAKYFDLLVGLVKGFLFGVLIFTIACFKGMRTTNGAAGVGKTTTSAVVITYCAILMSNFFLTMALNILRDQINRFLP